jgi:MFS transporter, DHA3 family, tetracycline resistance protein
MPRKWDAYKTYLLMRVLAAFGFSVTFGVNLIYQVAMVGLNPLQLVLVGTTLELAAFVFEIPTGVLADVYSRRLSVIIGYFLIGIGFFVEAIPTFTTVLLAQLIWGFGYTFISGASEAWIVDEVGNERANQAFVQAQKWSQIAGFLGLWVSILLGLIRLNMPHFIGGASLIALSVILILIMPEDGFQRTPAEERESWRDLFKTFGEGVKIMRLRPILMMIVGSSLLIGLFSEGWDRLHTAHLLTNFGLPDANGSYETLLLFGVIATVGSFLGFAGTTWLERKNWQSHEQLSTGLMWIYGIIGLAVLLFAWSSNLLMALVALWIMDLARTLSHPLSMSWINNHIDSKVRATVLSVSSQANAIGQIAGGPPVGYIGIVSGLRIAISISGLLMLPAVLLVTQIRAKGREEMELI